MTIALDSRPRTPTPPTGTANRWIPLAPAALLTVGMLGFAWLQVSAEADRSPTAPAVAAPAVPSTAQSSAAAPSEDAVPSLEDQELAAYATCGA